MYFNRHTLYERFSRWTRSNVQHSDRTHTQWDSPTSAHHINKERPPSQVVSIQGSFCNWLQHFWLDELKIRFIFLMIFPLWGLFAYFFKYIPPITSILHRFRIFISAPKKPPTSQMHWSTYNTIKSRDVICRAIHTGSYGSRYEPAHWVSGGWAWRVRRLCQ